MSWDQMCLENKIHGACLSGKWWNQGHSLTRSGPDLPVPPHFISHSSLPSSLQPLVFSPALPVLLIPFSFQPQGLCTCCFLCRDCSSLLSHLVNSYSSWSEPTFSEKPSLASPNTDQVKFSSDPMHLTFSVCVCVSLPSPYSLSSIETETMFMFA